jgi:membrane protease YdiL (CAAX protease family)
MPTPDATPPRRSPPRPVLAILLLLVVPVILGCLASPWVFRAVPRLNDAFLQSESDSLANPSFERVTSRCVSLAALFLLVPVIRMAGLGGHLGRSLAFSRSRWGDLARAWLLGCASMGALYAAGWLAGAYAPSPKVAGWGPAGARMLSFVAGSLFIGFFEEAFFRGFLFGAARTKAAFWPAALLTSAFFSSVHFMRPDAPAAVTDPAWHSGFALLPHLFAKVTLAKDWPFMTTLFFMGIALCGYVERKGCLHFAIGLHAGWVLAMQTAAYLLDRKKGFLDPLFSRSDFLSKGALALLVILPFAWYAARGVARATPSDPGQNP